MHRRDLLAAVAGGAVANAGCLDGPVWSDGSRDPDATPVTDVAELDPAVCDSDPRPARIPAINDPAFGRPETHQGEQGLEHDEPIVGVERDGDARAYPLSILKYEIVNDAFDVPILVTYCPLCASGMTAVRRVAGAEVVFANTSHTWRPPDATGEEAVETGRVFGASHRTAGGVEPTVDPNLVMFDLETGSYWSQLLAAAICGPATGQELTLVPSTFTEWSSWRAAHPETTVLLPPPASGVFRG